MHLLSQPPPPFACAERCTDEKMHLCGDSVRLGLRALLCLVLFEASTHSRSNCPPSLLSLSRLLFRLFRCVKALDRGSAKLCILSKDCDHDEYQKLIKALCREANVDLIVTEQETKLGEWCGLAKLNADGTVRKAVRCSVAVVTDFGEDSAALDRVLKYVESQRA